MERERGRATKQMLCRRGSIQRVNKLNKRVKGAHRLLQLSYVPTLQDEREEGLWEGKWLYATRTKASQRLS